MLIHFEYAIVRRCAACAPPFDRWLGLLRFIDAATGREPGDRLSLSVSRRRARGRVTEAGISGRRRAAIIGKRVWIHVLGVTQLATVWAPSFCRGEAAFGQGHLRGDGRSYGLLAALAEVGNGGIAA